jgi:hypothetical protein
MPWLVVEGLPSSYGAEDVERLCASFGRVLQVVMCTLADGTPLGCARVELASLQEAETVRLRLNGLVVRDHIITVAVLSE